MVSEVEFAALVRRWSTDPPIPPSQPAGHARPVPPEVRRTEHDQGITLRLPWIQGGGVGIHLAFVGLFALASFLALSSALGGQLPLFTGLFAFAVGLSYVFVLANKTVVEIRSDGVKVTHGPLPSYLDDNLELTLRDLEKLEVRESIQTFRGRVMRHYTLSAGPWRILRKFTSKQTVEYVAEVIAEGVEGPVEIRHL